MAHNLQIFFSIALIMILLGLFIPIFRTALNVSGSSPDVSEFEKTISGQSYLSILANIVVIPFWTFGLNTWINLVLLLPLRIIGAISLYYSISPAKS